MEIDATLANGGERKFAEELPKGSNKSGRWWKSVKKDRHSAVVKCKPLRSNWQKKMEKKAQANAVKNLQQSIREKMADEKKAKKEARIEQEKRRLENQRKAEVVQVIRNSAKLKKAKKKQLRKIEMRDTN